MHLNTAKLNYLRGVRQKMISNTPAAYDGFLTKQKTKLASNSAIFSISTVIFAAGFIKNDVSYLLLPFLIGLSLLMRRPSMPQSRLALIFLTIVLCIYGATLGVLRGNNIIYIMKFVAPIFVFAVLLALRNVGETLFLHRRKILLMCFVITALFTFLVKFRISSGVDLLMRGWTANGETATAVSVFHYFALAFCLIQIFEFVCVKKTDAGMIRTGIALITIACLLLMTDTSAFVLAVGVGLIAMSARVIRFAVIMRIIFFVIASLLVDYFTLQVFVRGFENYLLATATSDLGNSIRMVQVQYFVRNISLMGEGFGAAHAFPVLDHPGRQYLQDQFPYASELPVLNIVNNAGLMAAIWFFFVVKPVFHCFANVRSKDNDIALKSYFGVACGMVLVGSISNPFFFSPVSMLLLCVAADLKTRPSGQMARPSR